MPAVSRTPYTLSAALRAQMQSDPAYLTAQEALKAGSSTAPVQSGAEALVRALTGAVGGYNARSVQSGYDDRAKALAEALGQSSDPQVQRMAKLDPDTALAMAQKGQDLDSQAQQALITLNSGGTLNPQQDAAYKSWVQMQSAKVGLDQLGRAYSPFDASKLPQSGAPMGVAPQGAMGAAPQPVMGGQNGLLPPPATIAEMGGKAVKPDMALMQGTLPSPSYPNGVQDQYKKQLDIAGAAPMAAAQETGKLEAQRAFDKPAADRAIASTFASMDTKVQRLNELIGKANANTTGLLGSLFSLAPGSDAYDFKASNLPALASEFIGNLADLKTNSPNGASGLGSLTETEGKKVESLRANLDTAQSAEQYKKEAQKLLDQITQSTQIIKDAYKATYGELPQSVTQAAQSPLTGLDTLPDGYKDLGNGTVQGPDGKTYKMVPR